MPTYLCSDIFERGRTHEREADQEHVLRKETGRGLEDALAHTALGQPPTRRVGSLDTPRGSARSPRLGQPGERPPALLL